MLMGNVIVLGSLITDLVARAPRMPHAGESLFGNEFATFLGGKGFNQAVAAARLGAHVSLLGCVGTDTFGDAFFPVLASEHIASTYVTRSAIAGTGVASIIIAEDSGQNAIVVLPRANLALPSAAVKTAMHTLGEQQPIAEAPTLFLAQCETSRDSLITGIQLASKAGMTIILNAAPIPREPLVGNLLLLVDILIVNETEAATLTAMTVDSFESTKAAAELLLNKGPRHVVITLGARGALWSTYAPLGRLTHQELPLFPVKQVDATAAGDAFCGALAASLAEGKDMQEALKKASAAGALTVTKMGAFPSLPTAQEVEELLQKERA
ncbi:MAG: ribokinase [Ktedonobacteraceae bacterium]